MMERLRQAGRMLLAFLILLCLPVLPMAASVDQGETTITIVHVNDVHSRVEQTDANIGYAKLAVFVKQLKAENPNTLLLDAGDSLHGHAPKAEGRIRVEPTEAPGTGPEPSGAPSPQQPAPAPQQPAPAPRQPAPAPRQPAPAPQQTPAPQQQPSSGQRVCIVKRGDTLWAIARKYGTTWQKLAELNQLDNPDLLFPGQRILLP